MASTTKDLSHLGTPGSPPRLAMIQETEDGKVQNDELHAAGEARDRIADAIADCGVLLVAFAPPAHGNDVALERRRQLHRRMRARWAGGVRPWGLRWRHASNLRRARCSGQRSSTNRRGVRFQIQVRQLALHEHQVIHELRRIIVIGRAGREPQPFVKSDRLVVPPSAVKPHQGVTFRPRRRDQRTGEQAAEPQALIPQRYVEPLHFANAIADPPVCPRTDGLPTLARDQRQAIGRTIGLRQRGKLAVQRLMPEHGIHEPGVVGEARAAPADTFTDERGEFGVDLRFAPVRC